MNTHDACALLGVQIGADSDTVKAAFKKKAIEYHPDRNKSPDAEMKFKEVNEAFQLLEKFGTNPPAVSDVRSPFYNSADHLADEIKRQMDEVFYTGTFRRVGPPIVISVEIPFEMSIIGGRKEVSYTHLVKCHVCKDGKAKGPCHKCNGTGRRKYGSGAVTPVDNRELPCNGCVGTGVSSSWICGACMGTSKRQIVDTLLVRFQPGIRNGTRLTFNGKGNYNIKDFYDDLIIEVTVQPSNNGLTFSGDDVISTVELSLLEALQGTKKSLQTIKGMKVLEFKPKIRNGDRIRVSGFGLPPNGAHIFVVNVAYPEDVSELIAVLENNKPPPPDVDQHGLPDKD